MDLNERLVNGIRAPRGSRTGTLTILLPWVGAHVPGPSNRTKERWRARGIGQSVHRPLVPSTVSEGVGLRRRSNSYLDREPVPSVTYLSAFTGTRVEQPPLC